MAELSVKIDTRSLKLLAGEVTEYVDTLETNVRKALIQSGYDIKDYSIELIQGGPSRSGISYKAANGIHKASAKGEPAKNRTGDLVSSFAVVELQNGVEVGTLAAIAPHGEYLEDPNSLDRQFLYPSYKTLEPNIQATINRILSGGK